MNSVSEKIRFIVSEMKIEADITTNIKSTWDAIKETDIGKKIQIFVDRSKDALKRWFDSRMPGIARAISEGTGGVLSLTPTGELVSKDKAFRVSLRGL